MSHLEQSWIYVYVYVYGSEQNKQHLSGANSAWSRPTRHRNLELSVRITSQLDEIGLLFYRIETLILQLTIAMSSCSITTSATKVLYMSIGLSSNGLANALLFELVAASSLK